jgi:phage tail-like protein
VGTPVHFLVVEDDAVIRRAVGRAARGLMEVRFAETATAAMDALRAGPLPRFVLLDFVLPDGDGLQVLRQVRADPRFSSVPVVMFSSLQDPSKAQLTMQAGAQAWVRKPDDPHELREAVRTLCMEWGGPAPAPAAVTADPAHSMAAAPASADSYPGYRFRLRWEGRVVAAARECGALRRSSEVLEEAADATAPGTPVRRSPGRTWFLPLVLNDLVTDDEAFDSWAAHVGAVPHRKDIVLEACDDDGHPMAAYRLSACWASGYEAAPQASARGPVRVHMLRLEHEGWTRLPPAGAPSHAGHAAPGNGKSNGHAPPSGNGHA